MPILTTNLEKGAEYQPNPSKQQLDSKAGYSVAATFTPPADSYTAAAAEQWYPRLKPGAFWI